MAVPRPSLGSIEDVGYVTERLHDQGHVLTYASSGMNGHIEPTDTGNGDLLEASTYPGRGLIAGSEESGEAMILLYWITGRSSSSRNRVLRLSGDRVVTEWRDPDEGGDPRFRLYTAMRTAGAYELASNGDHTDTIADQLTRGMSPQESLTTIEHEDDPPIFTPRIVCALDMGGHVPTIMFGRASRSRSKVESSEHSCYFPDTPPNGSGFRLQTYIGSLEDVRVYSGPPAPVRLHGGLQEIAESHWERLHPSIRVAIAAKRIPLRNGDWSPTFYLKQNER